MYVPPNLLSMQQEALNISFDLYHPMCGIGIQTPVVLLLWYNLSAHFEYSQKVSETLLQITSLYKSSSVTCPPIRPFAHELIEATLGKERGL